MSDLIERLREGAQHYIGIGATPNPVWIDAADELERLRRELAEREQAHAFLVEVNNGLHGELAEARAKLTERLVAYCVCTDQRSPVNGCDCVCCTTARLERQLAEARGLLQEWMRVHDVRSNIWYVTDAFLAGDQSPG